MKFDVDYVLMTHLHDTVLFCALHDDEFVFLMSSYQEIAERGRIRMAQNDQAREAEKKLFDSMRGQTHK